jgi:putative ABC transport system substrate-binding protein
MKRREFISLLGGAALAGLPCAAHAQQNQRMRRIGVLHAQSSEDRERQASVAAFRQELERLGWIEGRNLHIDYRWSAGNAANTRQYAADLIALAPDVIMASGAAPVAPLVQSTRSVPIVFVLLADPVGAGIVDSLAHPGGNVTGFTSLEYGFGGKWLDLLKEAAPGMKRVAVIRDPSLSVGIGLFGAVQAAAPPLGIETVPVGVRDAPEIERAIAAFARQPNGGMLVTASALAFVHRSLLIELAERHKLPAVYPTKLFARTGGLLAYGPDNADQYRRAAGYVDRILKGEKPADLPVQAPTKYELVINLKTAKALGLDVPDTLLARADEVME